MVRLIDHDDLSICDLCEDYICDFHDKHFYDCECELEMWAGFNHGFEDEGRVATNAGS